MELNLFFEAWAIDRIWTLNIQNEILNNSIILVAVVLVVGK
jgi:hypothetical protein